MNALERLAASVLCVGFDGDSPAAAPLAELAALRPGGIVLFAHNVTDARGTTALVDAIRDALGDPHLLVAIDQEGGRVARLRRDATPLPPPMAVAAAGDVQLAEALAYATARDLRRFGANVNFAPVADLASDPQSAIVGTRSFSSDEVEAAEFVVAVVRGLQRGGVAATLKHFPGHGLTGEDSHLGLPVIDAAADEIQWHMSPFRAGIEGGARAIMMAHAVVNALDSDLPASLSAPIVEGILRGELGFHGVCFTDCLEMGAIKDNVGTARATVLALLAGVDAPVISHHLDVARAGRDAIVASLESGELSRARVDSAASRLDALRHAAGSAETAAPDGLAVAKEVARRAILPMRGKIRLNPDRPVNVVSFEGSSGDGVAGAISPPASLQLALRRRHYRSELLRVPLEPNAEEIAALLDVVRAQRDRSLVALTRRPRFRAGQVRAVDALLQAVPDAVVAIASEPFDAACFPSAKNVVCSFGDDELLVEALADMLSGRFP